MFSSFSCAQIRLTLHNVSFGDASTCNTEPDIHTGRPQCVSSTDPDLPDDSRRSELKLFDVPFRDVKLSLGCFCDNTTSMYATPVTVQSLSRTLELTFAVTKLNISEDFADIYFYASYEFVKVPDCKRRMRLRGAGGEDTATFPLLPMQEDSDCDSLPWFIEAQHWERSLFVLTWGSYLPHEFISEEALLRCPTKNRLIVYTGRPLRVARIICPTAAGPRPTALHLFSDDWSTPLMPHLLGSR